MPLQIKGIEKPHYFDHWINLRLPFSAAFGLGNVRFTLQDAIRKAGLQWEGRLHCGLDDALNTAHLLVELMRRGTLLKIIGSLAPTQSPPQPQHKAVLPCVGSRSTLPPQPQPQVLLPCAAATGMDAVSCCFCGVASKLGVVATPGQMQGHYFYGCGWWTPTCSFFMWAI
jgi:ERI1 exoribonuclease 2